MLRQRVNAGLKAARRRGRLGGRPRSLTEADLKKARAFVALGRLHENSGCRRTASRQTYTLAGSIAANTEVTALSLTIVNPVELLCRLFKCTQDSRTDQESLRLSEQKAFHYRHLLSSWQVRPLPQPMKNPPEMPEEALIKKQLSNGSSAWN